MAKEKVEGFPVFAKYEWVGPKLDGILDDMNETDIRGGAAAVDAYLRRPEISATLKAASIKPTSAKVVEWFFADDRPSLFLELANLKPAADEMLEFVRRNGLLLGIPPEHNTALVFVHQVRSIRLANFMLYVTQKELNPQHRETMVPVANERLREMVGEHLAGVSPVLDEQLRLAPSTGRLVDAIWLQLAKAADARRQVAKCQRCERFFEVSGGTSRTDRAYCSNACRLAAYRARKQRAVALHSEGLSVREIAKQLSSDVDTVKGWLRQKGE